MFQPSSVSRSACRTLLSGRALLLFLFLVACSSLPALGAVEHSAQLIQTATAQAEAPAATIIWRAANNPHVISGTYTIPAGTTVIMEAGVIVQFNPSASIQLDGELIGQGTSTKRIQLNGAADGSSRLNVKGTLNLSFTDVDVFTVPQPGGPSMIYADCKIKRTIFTFSGYLFQTPAYVQLDRCNFDGAELTLDHANLAMRDVSFTNGAFARIYYSYVYLDRVTSDKATNDALSFVLDGNVYFNNLTVTNAGANALSLDSAFRAGNYFLGPNVQLSGNNYPVALHGGLLPGSTLPATGNTNNVILASGGGVDAVWGKMAIPYVVPASTTISLSSTTLMPGVTVKMSPDSGIDGGADYIVERGFKARGTAAEPITFQRLDPTRSWFAIGFQNSGQLFEYVTVEGASTGVSTANNAGFFVYLNDCILRNNTRGSSGATFATGTQYLNNTYGYVTSGGVVATQGAIKGAPASPNSFVGNGQGILNNSTQTIPAQNNWWGSPSGPRTQTNPGGTGDSADGGDVIPFLTTPPNYAADTPPVVRWHKPFFTYNPGTKVTLSWDSQDDKGIVAHRIYFSKAGTFPGSHELVAEVPGTQHAYEWIVPNIGFQVTNERAYIRVSAIDTAGHERWDDARLDIPSGELSGTLTFTTPLEGRTFKSGEKIDLTYTYSDSLRYEVKDVFLQVEGENYIGTQQVPAVSTDTARFAIRATNNGNRILWFFSPYFKIRPDARIGDQPPVVTLNSPQPGVSFTSGNPIPVTWTASDDEALRSFNVQVSYDGGLSWTTVAKDLPATATSYNMETAPGTGYSDVRVRVIAFDRRFQNTSDGAARSFSITGSPVNVNPTVGLATPGAESQFNAPASVNISAVASDSDGTITSVDFYANGNLIGTATSAPYQITWNDIPSGSYSLTARSTDNGGGTALSSAVNIKVNALAPPPSQIPGAQWAAVYNGPSSRFDDIPKMALDGQGNVIITSSSTGVETQQDIATTKYDANGNQLWAVRYSGTYNDEPMDIAADAQGNVYVTGTTWRGLNYDGGTEYDYITLKYSPSGQLLWTRFYTGTETPSWEDEAAAMDMDAAGNIYVTGHSFRHNAAGNLVAIFATIKYDADGNQKWVRTYDSPQELGAGARDIRVDPAGNVYVTGSVTVAPSQGTLTDDIYTIKYDTNGNRLWAAQFDTPGRDDDFDSASRLKLDAQGNIYIVGHNWPNVDDGYDFLTLKYTNNGVLKWSRNWRTPEFEGATDLAFDAAGNIFVVGSATVVHNGGYPNSDAVTVKYDPAGTELWSRVYNGPGDGEDGGICVVTDSAGNAYVGMQSQNVNTYDYTVAKYAPNGTETVNRYNAPNTGGSDTLYQIAIDGAGNLYLTGTSNISSGVLDVVTIKIGSGAPAPVRRKVFDYDGDGRTDISVWQADSGKWHIIRSSDASVKLQFWGESRLGDIAAPGDYDGDGRTDIAIYRPSEGNWYVLQSSTGGALVINWGQGADRPVPADYDGDGKTDLAIYRPSEGNWYVRKSTGGSIVQGWGNPTDKLMPADYDGDGKADIAVWRPEDGNWYIRKSTGGSLQQNWGLGGDQPVAADYDGDGRADLAVFRPSQGNWYIVQSSGGAIIRNWGDSNDRPVPGDYDGDGKADIAVWRPSQGTWYVIQSSTNTGWQQYLGGGIDIPIPSAYLPQ